MFLRVLENNLPEVPKRDKIKHAVEKQAAAKQIKKVTILVCRRETTCKQAAAEQRAFEIVPDG